MTNDTEKYVDPKGGSPTLGIIDVILTELTYKKLYYTETKMYIIYYLSYNVAALMSAYIWIDAARLRAAGRGKRKANLNLTDKKTP